MFRRKIITGLDIMALGRILTIIDNFTRESLGWYVGQSITGHHVAEVLDSLVMHRGKPQRIQVDNGSEFTSKAMDQWAYFNQVKLDFSRRGKPTDNAFIESFNGKFRAECWNQNCSFRRLRLVIRLNSGGNGSIFTLPFIYFLTV